MDFNENLPIYVQIMNLLKAKIAAGEIKVGEKLPSVRELSKEFKVNPNTIQRGYQELEREGIIYTQRGMGTFVTENIQCIDNLKKEMASKFIKDFISNMKKIGYSLEDIKGLIKDLDYEEDKE